MKVYLTLTLALILLLSGVVSSQKREVFEKIRQIKVLKSTREDVLQLLGRPTNDETNDIWSYRVEAGEIDISFTNGKCISVRRSTGNRDWLESTCVDGRRGGIFT